MATVYLDNAATTPLDPRGRARRCSPYLDTAFGNPSSLHRAGREARAAVDEAQAPGGRAARRRTRGDRLHRQRHRGRQPRPAWVPSKRTRERRHFVTSAIEHPAVLETLRYLESRGATVTHVSPGRGRDRRGRRRRGCPAPGHPAGLDHGGEQRGRHPAAGRGDRRPRARSAASCSTPTPCRRPARCRSTCVARRSTCCRSPRTSSTGRRASARSSCAPVCDSAPIVHGGGQERGLRSATENVAGIVGFGRAAAIARARDGRGGGAAGAAARPAAGGRRGARAERLPHRSPLPAAARPPVPGARRVRRARRSGCCWRSTRPGSPSRPGSACSASHAGEPSLRAAGDGPRSDPRPRLAAPHARPLQRRGRGGPLPVGALPELVPRLRPVMSRPLTNPDPEGEAA